MLTERAAPARKSRLTAPTLVMQLALRTCNVRDVISDAVHVQRGVATEKGARTGALDSRARYVPPTPRAGVRLENVWESSLPELQECDDLRMSQVVINLLSNAVKCARPRRRCRHHCSFVRAGPHVALPAVTPRDKSVRVTARLGAAGADVDAPTGKKTMEVEVTDEVRRAAGCVRVLGGRALRERRRAPACRRSDRCPCSVPTTRAVRIRRARTEAPVRRLPHSARALRVG